MKAFLADLFARLSSRKFLLALAAFLTFVADGNTMEAVAVVLGYLGVEGVNDAIKQ